jgi:hypothetical protein
MYNNSMDNIKISRVKYTEEEKRLNQIRRTKEWKLNNRVKWYEQNKRYYQRKAEIKALMCILIN